METNDLIIGIDLGTTNSLASIMEKGTPRLIKSEEQTTNIPSIVSILNNKTSVGEKIELNEDTETKQIFSSVKRLIGKSFSEVASLQNTLPFTIEEGENNSILCVANQIKITPEEISALILKEIKHRSSSILEQPIQKCVITVPAYFNEKQRQATQKAATLAGLEVVRIINEPTAAALAYGLDNKEKGKIAIYDLGGGTFDVSILEYKDKLFKVLSTQGNTQLGGDDIDHAILQHIKKHCFPTIQFTSSQIQYGLQVAKNIKEELTTKLETTTTLSFPNQESCTFALTRQEFDRLCEPLVNQTIEHMQLALQDAALSIDDITHIILVGGSSRIPLVHQKIEAMFNKKPYLHLNPDRAIAFGAARQGFLLNGGKADFLLLDIIPLSLGIETIGGIFSKLIMKNASLPASVTETFSTSVDNQTAIQINIYQGERELIQHCQLIGQFTLHNIPAMPAGLPRIEVRFTVDTNGLLSVQAKEMRSDTKAELEVVPTHTITKQEAYDMLSSAMDYAEDDFLSRNLIEFRNQANFILQGLEKIWDQADLYISKEQKEAILAQKEIILATMKKEDPNALKQTLDKMGELTRELADSIMGNAAKQKLI